MIRAGSQAPLVCSDSSKFCIVSHLLLSDVALFSCASMVLNLLGPIYWILCIVPSLS